MFGDGWKNHIMLQHDPEWANETYLNDDLKSSKTTSFINMVFTDDRKRSLSRKMISHSFDYSQSGSVDIEH